MGRPSNKGKPGRPKMDNPKCVVVPVRMDANDLQVLDVMCAEIGTTRSDMIRYCLWIIRAKHNWRKELSAWKKLQSRHRLIARGICYDEGSENE